MKKIGVLLLCALLAASVMTACQNGEKGGNSSQTSSAASSAQTSISPKRWPPNCALPPNGCCVTSEYGPVERA